LKKSSALLIVIVLIVFMAGSIFTIRSLINFGDISSYITEPVLTGMIYDLLYFIGFVIIAFSVVIVILLAYLISMVESLVVEEAPPGKAKTKRERKRKEAPEKPSWPPPEEDE